jgi:hypothetical protein
MHHTCGSSEANIPVIPHRSHVHILGSEKFSILIRRDHSLRSDSPKMSLKKDTNKSPLKKSGVNDEYFSV